MKLRIEFPRAIKQVSDNAVEIVSNPIGNVCSSNVYDAIKHLRDEDYDYIINVMNETFNRLYVRHSIKVFVVKE